MLTINLSELILTVANFFLLLFLLKHFLYTPLIAFMDARNARVEAAMEQVSSAREAVREEELRIRESRRQYQEEARRIVRDGCAADERRYAERMAQVQAQNFCDRKVARAAECQRNQDEKLQLEDAGGRLAVLLAECLLNRFPDMPSVLVGNGLRLAVEKAESTWKKGNSELQHKREASDIEVQKSADLYAAECAGKEEPDLQNDSGEQRQLEEQWEQLAALLAERLLCPGA